MNESWPSIKSSVVVVGVTATPWECSTHSVRRVMEQLSMRWTLASSERLLSSSSLVSLSVRSRMNLSPRTTSTSPKPASSSWRIVVLNETSKGGPVKMSSDFNLEAEYGDLLDLIESNIAEMSEGLKHYGVKGMKWGVRKSDKPTREPLKSLGPDTVSRKTASGETITLQKVPPTKVAELTGRMSKKYREWYSKNASLDILDGSGKKVGDAYVTKRNKDELYLNWLGIDKSARGKGYATAVMQAGRDFGKQEGFKKMTLEVPG